MANKGNPIYKLSRYITRILRHSPQELHLSLDELGFVTIAEITHQLNKKNKYSWVEEHHIHEVVSSQRDKQRLEIVEDKIRACYGHSSKEVQYTPVEPPEVLYHGTPQANIESIREKGLLAGSRKYVHLSSTESIAKMVGSRHAKDIVILNILCKKAREAGIEFYNPEEQIWLVKHLPSEYIKL